MFKHIERWNKWRKRNRNSKLHKLLVLLKLAHSPTFKFTFTDEEEAVYKAFWEGVEKDDRRRTGIEIKHRS